MQKQTKIISFHSPLSQTGQTSIVNLVGCYLAKQDNYVAILELSKYTGMSVFLNKKLGNLKNDLKTCLIDPTKVRNNLVESVHSNKLFFLSQNSKSTASDLTSYNSKNIDLIVEQLMGSFDYVLIDLPSEITDVAAVRVLGSNFKFKIDHRVITITENVLALKKLNDYDNMISRSVSNRDKREKTTLVVNKSKVRYSPAFEPYLTGLPYTEIVNLVNVPYVEEFPYLANEGNIFSLGRTKEAKQFYGSTDMIARIIEEDIEGVGISRSVKASQSKRKVQNTNIFDMLGKKGKKKGKKSKPPKQGKTPKNSKNNKNKKQGGLFGGKGGKKPKQEQDQNMNYNNNYQQMDDNYNNQQQFNFDQNQEYYNQNEYDSSGMNFDNSNLPKGEYVE